MMYIKMHYRGAIPSVMKKREFNNTVLKPAWEAVGAYWHRHMLPKHFTEQGAREYHYAKRTRNYQKRKRREKGHNLPLVWSGESRRMSRTRNVKATFKGVKVLVRAPGLNRIRRSKSGKGINKRDELVRVTQREAGTLRDVWKRNVKMRIAGITTKRTERIAAA